jgi:M6 family metalloprotease-like protein
MIKHGLSFFDGCGPTLAYSFESGDEAIDPATSSIRYAIQKGTTSFAPGALLDVGDYHVYATYSPTGISSDVISFSVVDASPVEAEEGRGYHTPTTLANYALANHPNLSALRNAPLKSTGTRKILVVPVYFANGSGFSDEDISLISKAYNGSSSDTGWQSLSGYYKTSSYGALDIGATVTSPFQYEKTDTAFETLAATYGASYDQATNSLAEAIVSSLRETYAFGDYDQDQDGYLDGLEMVYKTTRNDAQEGGADIWWNYTSFDVNGQASAPIKTGIYFWSEFSRLSNGYYSPDIDCHTLIHESGHMMGLNDYYSYDDATGAPAGMCDMMDFNIGDHNAYSKMVLGWIAPKVIDGTLDDFTLSLQSFTDTSDCVLLRNMTTDPWNGTPYDEYLMLQYFTPTGLNYSDSVYGYPEWSRIGKGGLYKRPGLQVFHVDSRLLDTNYIQYSDRVYSASYIAASNTPSSSVNVDESAKKNDWVFNSPFKQIKAIPATGIDSYCVSGTSYYSYLGAQTTLFGTASFAAGSSFYSNYAMKGLYTNLTRFNDGSSLNWNFSVVGQASDSITLHFVEA